MRAGQLRRSVSVEKVTETRTASGAISDVWATFKTMRARKRKLSGREFYAASVVNLEESIEYRIRFVAGITTKMRVNDNGEYLDIQSIIDPEERGRELILVCSLYE